METTITRTIKASQMVKMFNAAHDCFTVKFYESGQFGNKACIESKKYKFEILIRHMEETDASQLFDAAFNKMFPTTKPEKSEYRKARDLQAKYYREGWDAAIKANQNQLKPIYISNEAFLQLTESVNSAEGRITNGAEIEEGFNWLREELEQINNGVSVNDTSLTA